MKKRALDYFGYLVVIISFYFIVRLLLQMDISNIKLPDLLTTAILVFLFTLPIVATMFMAAYAWKMNIDLLTQKVNDYKPLLIVYVRANISKYIPGNVMQFVSRNFLANKLGLKHHEIALSTLIELFLISLSSISIVLILVVFGSIQIPQHIQDLIQIETLAIIGSIVIVLCVLGVLIVFFKKREIITKFILKIKQFSYLRFGILFIKNMIMYSLIFILSGIVLVLIYQYLLDVPIDSIGKVFVIISGFVISWLLGYVMPGAPGGIGIRESIMVLLFSPYFGKENALFAGVIYRIVTILADVFVFILSSRVVNKYNKLDG